MSGGIVSIGMATHIYDPNGSKLIANYQTAAPPSKGGYSRKRKFTSRRKLQKKRRHTRK